MNVFSLIKQYNFAIIATDERLAKIDSLPTFAAKIKYCKSLFNQLASGSARVVFDYNNDYVLKVAKNPKGIAQNNVENDGLIQNSYTNICTKIIEEGNDNSWLLVQKAKKITPSKFEALTGVNFKLFSNYMEYVFRKNNWLTFDKDKKEQLDENEFVQNVVSLVADYAMPVGDIVRISSWGEVNDGGGKAVLTDYGLTQDVFDEFYKR